MLGAVVSPSACALLHGLSTALDQDKSSVLPGLLRPLLHLSLLSGAGLPVKEDGG